MVKIDSHGFPMRDDLKEHVQITRICYDGIFYMDGSRLCKKGKEVVDLERVQAAKRKK